MFDFEFETFDSIFSISPLAKCSGSLLASDDLSLFWEVDCAVVISLTVILLL